MMYTRLRQKKREQHTEMEDSGSVIHDNHNFFPISLFILHPEIIHDFRVYLKQGDKYVLYTKEREKFSEHLKQRLAENDIQTVYVPYTQQENYENYMFDNLGDILDNSHIPNEVRSQVFLDMSKNEVDKIFQDNSLLLDAATLENLYHIVQSSVDFLSFDDSLRNIGKLVSHDYMTYSQCVHVFVYVTAMMQRLQFDLKMITLYL